VKRRTFISGLGSAAAWPLVARGQQSAVPVIGYLNGGAELEGRRLTAAFHQGLGEQGFVEGRNVEIIYRWAENQYDRLPVFAEELVRRRVAVIVTTAGGGTAIAAKSATTSIPIVFQTGADPIKVGLVTNFSHPGGNVTGVAMLTVALIAKRLELLHEIVPHAAVIGFLVNPATPRVEEQIREAQNAAHRFGLRLVIGNASTPNAIEAAFADFALQPVEALLVDTDPLFFVRRDQLSELAARYALPAIYHAHEITEAGGLMSYGSHFADAYRLAGGYAGRILKGDRPADLPVQQVTKIEFVINLKTAKALGITFPISLLGRADEVIE
jgi:putative ABC transport system substrate-binding protein